MKLEYNDRKLGATFGYTDHLQKEETFFAVRTSIIKILWNRNEAPVEFLIDGRPFALAPHQITTATYFQHVDYPAGSAPVSAFRFNREFYCIADHDQEVSCNGILFFGTQNQPVITIPPEQQRKFDLLLEVIREEFRTVDQIQGEMLQMLLKRLIIICTRLAKEQLIVPNLSEQQIDIIRRFNVLVDVHFRTHHKVKDYAALLHKSPKTLSNLFAVYNQKSPHQIIQERIVLEAKRLMLYSDKQTKEIAFDLGFADPAYFSRYFKKIAKVSPSEFKSQKSA